MTGDTGHPLRFDFAFCDEKGTNDIDNKAIRLLLELQGPHHYKAGYYNEYGEFIEDCSPESKQKLNKQLSFDERKHSFCEKSGIPLEVIKYTKSSNYEQLKRQIFELLMHYGFIQEKDKLPFS